MNQLYNFQIFNEDSKDPPPLNSARSSVQLPPLAAETSDENGQSDDNDSDPEKPSLIQTLIDAKFKGKPPQLLRCPLIPKVRYPNLVTMRSAEVPVHHEPQRKSAGRRDISKPLSGLALRERTRSSAKTPQIPLHTTRLCRRSSRGEFSPLCCQTDVTSHLGAERQKLRTPSRLPSALNGYR